MTITNDHVSRAYQHMSNVLLQDEVMIGYITRATDQELGRKCTSDDDDVWYATNTLITSQILMDILSHYRLVHKVSPSEYVPPTTNFEVDNRDLRTTWLRLTNGTVVEVDPMDLFINALEQLGH